MDSAPKSQQKYFDDFWEGDNNAGRLSFQKRLLSKNPTKLPEAIGDGKQICSSDVVHSGLRIKEDTKLCDTIDKEKKLQKVKEMFAEHDLSHYYKVFATVLLQEKPDYKYSKDSSKKMLKESTVKMKCKTCGFPTLRRGSKWSSGSAHAQSSSESLDGKRNCDLGLKCLNSGYRNFEKFKNAEEEFKSDQQGSLELFSNTSICSSKKTFSIESLNLKGGEMDRKNEVNSKKIGDYKNSITDSPGIQVEPKYDSSEIEGQKVIKTFIEHDKMKKLHYESIKSSVQFLEKLDNLLN